MSFSTLKKNRVNQINDLVSAAAKLNEKKSFTDERVWAPTVNKDGNGFAIIRFLPVKEEGGIPWVRYWDHGFKGPTGRWYIENSLTTLGQDDPVSEMNTKLWNSGIEADKATVRERKRRLHYVSNILVVNDPENPDNNGKVFFYKYGKKIHDKILDSMQPEFPDDKPVNPFDLWEGANFRLKIRNVEGYRNYDKSEFDSPTPVAKTDDEIEVIYNQIMDINEFVDPKNFKSYDELKKKLDSVLGIAAQQPTVSTADQIQLDEHEEMGKSPVESSDSDDEEGLSYFKKMAEED